MRAQSTVGAHVAATAAAYWHSRELSGGAGFERQLQHQVLQVQTCSARFRVPTRRPVPLQT